MLIQENDNKNVLVCNTPKSLNLNSLFSEYSQTYIDKIIFIIHQCNYYHFQGTGYNFNIDDHRVFLGLSPNHTTAIKNKLVQLNIIKLHSDRIIKKKSAYYTIVKPFDIKNDAEVNRHYFNTENDNCPNFAIKFINNGFKMKVKEEVKSLSSDKEVIQQLQDEIKALREQLAKYEAQSIVKDIQVEPEALSEVKDPVIMVAPQPSAILDEVTETVPYDEDYEKFKIEYLKRKNQTALK